MKYACDSGFEMTSQASPLTVSCQYDGTFSDMPQCTPVPCAALEPISDGSVSANAGVYGDVVTFACDEG